MLDGAIHLVRMQFIEPSGQGCVALVGMGAVGINLTQANRVFLLETGFNPGLVAQCIGRVWRLGQKRPVEVVRLLMKDSVETRMMKMLQAKYGTTDTTLKPPPGTALVGSVAQDKADVLANEFDGLFNYVAPAEGDRQQTTPTNKITENDVPTPDDIGSGPGSGAGII